MFIRILLTHSQKNFSISVSLCTPRQTVRKSRSGYRDDLTGRTVANRRRRADDTLLRPMWLGIFATQVEPTTHASGCAHEERDGETNDADCARYKSDAKSCCACSSRNLVRRSPGAGGRTRPGGPRQ